MKQIEDPFQNIVSKIVSNALTDIDSIQMNCINMFFALWKLRAEQKEQSLTGVTIEGVHGEALTKDEQEILEKKWALFILPNKTIPSHQFTGLQLQFHLDSYVHELSSVQWGIIQSIEGEFIVPDNPDCTIIPITPSICLCDGGQNGLITKENLASINARIKTSSRNYYFAHNLDNCP